MSWFHGRHGFKTGVELRKVRWDSASAGANLFGNVTFANTYTRVAGVAASGHPYADFLFGVPTSAARDFPPILVERSRWMYDFFFQDDWKITSRLTANLGLRYSNESPFSTKYGTMTNFDPAVKDDLTGNMGAFIHPSSGLWARDNNNFNPRIGLAWHPIDKWVFRAGFGTYTVDIRYPSNRGQFEEYVAVANQQAAPGDPTPIYTLSRGPDPVKYTVRSNGTAAFVGTNYGSRSVDWWDPKSHNPYVMNFNGSAQWEFSRNYLLEFSYQGSSGVGLLERWQYNTFPIDFLADNPTQRNIAFAATQNYRPFTHFGDIRVRSNFGHSTFHSGTVKLEKRMSGGLFFSGFYTFAKALDSQDNDNDGSGVAPIQNRGLEKARAGFDRTHRFIGVLNYELPFGHGKRWLANGFGSRILGGLELSWIQTQESGNPITFGFAGSPYNYWPGFAGSQRPDLVGDIRIRDNWLDIGSDRFTTGSTNSVYTGTNNGLSNFTYPGGCGTATTIPAGTDRTKCDFRVGNSGRNIMTGLPLRWTQVSVQKNFRIGDRWKAQLRWDMQNAFKTFNFNTPNNTVDFRNPQNFGKVSSDPTTASLGGQPLMNLTVMIQW